ncbi:MAG: PAS domain S-box protein, partial [Rhodocyclaceae bacterium]|nr:PAS domain S-box protein [Rhodocyclaceae bacterium]
MPTPDNSLPPSARGRMLLAVFVAFSLAITAAGTFFYRALADDLMRDRHEELTAVAVLKARQVEDWLVYNRALVQVTAGSVVFAEDIENWRSTADPKLERPVRSRLEALQRIEQSDAIELFDPDGKKLLGVGESGHAQAALLPLIPEVLLQSAPLLLDLHRHADGVVHLGFLAAVRDSAALDQPPAALLLYSINTEKGLLPLIKNWPRASASGEIVLARRDGDQVMHLTGVHHGQGAPMSLGIPMDQTQRPAVQALRHGAGIYAGPDYNDTPVLLAAYPVAGTPWMLLAKVDEAEVTAGLRQLGATTLVLMLLAIGAAGALVFMFWHQQQLRTALAQAEQERTISLLEQRFGITLNSIGDAVIATDAAGNVEFLNPIAASLTGWSFDDARGRPLEEIFVIVNEETRQPAESPVRRVLRDGKIVGLANHTLLIARDGRETPISDSGAPIRAADETDGVSGVVLVFRDQSAEQAAARTLRESEAKFRLIAENASDFIFWFSPTGNFIYVSPACEKLTGYAPEEFMADPGLMLQIIHPDDCARVKSFMQNMSSGMTETSFRIMHRDGSERWISRVCTPAVDEEGVCVGRHGRMADITERKRYEEQLRKLALAVEQSPESVVITDLAGNIEYVNEAFTTVSGLAAEELIGQNPRILKSGKTPAATYV